MAGVRATLNVSLAAVLTAGAVAGVAPRFRTNINRTLEFTPGTATKDQADLFYEATRTLAASATENLDLNGVLINPLGGAFPAAEIVAIYVEADAANTNNVVVGAAGSNPFIGPMSGTGTLTLRPGEFCLFSSREGWAVTASTGDLLKVANSAAGTAVNYTIVIIGRTVAA